MIFLSSLQLSHENMKWKTLYTNNFSAVVWLKFVCQSAASKMPGLHTSHQLEKKTPSSHLCHTESLRKVRSRRQFWGSQLQLILVILQLICMHREEQIRWKVIKLGKSSYRLAEEHLEACQTRSNSTCQDGSEKPPLLPLVKQELSMEATSSRNSRLDRATRQVCLGASRTDSAWLELLEYFK